VFTGKKHDLHDGKPEADVVVNGGDGDCGKREEMTAR